jgi:pleurocidin family protein
MKTARVFLVLFLVLIMAPGRAFAGQQHIVAPGTIAAATAERTAVKDADRASIREALARPEVQSAAAKLGVSVGRLESAVNTLSGADLERAASTARQVNDQLVGGASTVTISTTVIIIALLIIILIVVIAK